MELIVILPPNYEQISEVSDEHVAELSAIFDAARADPATVYPVGCSVIAWKSPFIATVPNEKVAKLVEAIEWFDADYKVVVTDLGNGNSTVSTSGYQAW